MIQASKPSNLIGHTEWWAASELKEWINEIFRQKNLRYAAGVELKIQGKRSDILIRDLNKPICEIEVKPPSWDVMSVELIRDAYSKAYNLKAPYFATWNINKLMLFDAEKYDKTKSIHESLLKPLDVASITDLRQMEEAEHKIRIRSAIESFVDALIQFYEGKATPPKIAADEYLIFRLRSTIESLSNAYRINISKKVKSDLQFKKKVADWFVEQAWSFTDSQDDYERIARQAAYLLINKILFYGALQEKYGLEPLIIPDSLLSGSRLQHELKWFFEQILKIDYETIFSTEFIDEVGFPEDVEAVISVRGLANEISRYKISALGYDILGNIFENLIPEKERHKFGQYFTNSDVVDLILRFCLRSEKDLVIDPACGAGTFLVRSYHQKKMANPRLKHNDILPTLWGVDISKFASHLSTINLAIRGLEEKENYPRILHKDFFELESGKVSFGVLKKAVAKGLDAKEREFEHPEAFDAVVGNPPYTRQEEMEDMTEEGYKSELINKALCLNGEKLAEIGRRAGIHAYFFVHGYKFLKEGGRFGFIVSNSWLDVDYGKGLQEFFLKKYKILAIIESKVERWFSDADVNTSIIILEKCGKKDARDANLVRFVQLKKPLRTFIPQASKEWAEEKARLDAIDQLIQQIMVHNQIYETDEIKIYPKSQNELWDEGYDREAKEYVGAKWGKYVRAPPIFFKILEKGKGKLVPLKEVADVRRGFTTGANEFFYLTEEEIKHWGIEKEFWMHKDENGKWIHNYVIKSPRECKSIIVKPEDLKYRVLMIHKDKKALEGTNVLKYIEYGESNGFHERPTCASRERWYDLGERDAAFININYLINDVARCFVGKVFVSDNFQEIHTEKDPAPFLNSTVFWLFQNISGRTTFGEGLLKIQTYEFQELLVCPSLPKKAFKVFDKLTSRRVESVFSEIGANSPEEVSLEKVKADRRELDKIIMGEILGLSDDEQLEVYRAVVDLVKSRIEKAHSVERKSKRKGDDSEILAKRILDSLGGDAILSDFFAKLPDVEVAILPRFKKEIEVRHTLNGWQITDGKINANFDNQEKAKYCKILAQLGIEKVKVPKSIDKKTLSELENITSIILETLEENLETITDRKTREKVKGLVIGRIVGKCNRFLEDKK